MNSNLNLPKKLLSQLTEPLTKLIISKILSKGKCWLVGGTVRDIILGKESKDIDLATDLTPDELEKLSIFGIDALGKKHGITRVPIGPGKLLDIGTLRKDIYCDGRHAVVEFTKDITEDLARRDLTINSIAIEIKNLEDTDNIEIIDPYGGIHDLNLHAIRFVGNPEHRIKEDYLRILRALRFTCLGDEWYLEEIDQESIKKNIEGLKEVSKERVRDEIMKALSYKAPHKFWQYLEHINGLPLVLPELQKAVGCKQNKFHSYDPVFNHVVRCLKNSVELTDKPLLRLTALLHDIAKPATKVIKEDGEPSFYKHEIVGTKIVYEWMQEYKFPREDIVYVTKLVRNHQFQFQPNSKDKTIKKWLRGIGKDLWKDLITLRMIDRSGNLYRQGLPLINQELQELIERIEKILTEKQPVFQEDIAINGHDLIALGIKPGPVFKQILNQVLSLVIDNPTRNTKEFLTTYIREKYL